MVDKANGVVQRKGVRWHVTGAEQAPKKELEAKKYAGYIAKYKRVRENIVDALVDKPPRSIQSCTLPSEMRE